MIFYLIFFFSFLVFMIRSGLLDGANYLILFVTFFSVHLFDKKKDIVSVSWKAITRGPPLVIAPYNECWTNVI